MTPFRMQDVFKTDPATFWQVFFDRAFNEHLYAKIGVKERTVSVQREDDRTITRHMRVIPVRDLPAFMAKLIPGDFGYDEEVVLEKATGIMQVKARPTFGTRNELKGTIHLDPTGEGEISRIFEGIVKVEVPLVGGKIERIVLEDVVRSNTVTTAVTRSWLART